MSIILEVFTASVLHMGDSSLGQTFISYGLLVFPSSASLAQNLIGFSKCLKVLEFPLDVVQFPKAAFCSMFSFLSLRCQFGFAKACFSLKHSFFL